MPHTKSFNRLLRNLEDEYLGEQVPNKYQNRYGKRYDKKDIKSFGYAIAKSKGIKIDRR